MILQYSITVRRSDGSGLCSITSGHKSWSIDACIDQAVKTMRTEYARANFLEEGMWVDIEIQCLEAFGALVYDVVESLRYNATELRNHFTND